MKFMWCLCAQYGKHIIIIKYSVYIARQKASRDYDQGHTRLFNVILTNAHRVWLVSANTLYMPRNSVLSKIIFAQTPDNQPKMFSFPINFLFFFSSRLQFQIIHLTNQLYLHRFKGDIISDLNFLT